MVHRLLVALLLAYLAVAASYAQDYGSDQGEVNEHHFIRVWLDPTKMAVGERATLNVMVGVDSFFTGSTELALPAIERALVLQSQPAVNGGENLQGKNFTTQTHKIDIYPDHKGILTVPSFRVTFKQSMEVYGQLTSQPVQLATEQLLGLVSVPPAMAGETGFMVSSDVKITDDWSGDEKGEFKVGDVLTRVVTIVAADMASMNMPQFTPYAPSGVSVTLAEPRLSSTSGREEAAATMVQHISYAVESPGQYTLGTEVLSWWDPKAASRRDHRFADKPVDAGGLPWRLVAIVVSVSVPVLLLILVMRRYLRRRDAVDVAIRQQLHRGDASKRLAALYAYADYHKLQGEQPVRLRALLPASQALVEKVMSARYSSNGIDGEPSRGESKSLYRQMRKDFPC
ncbi:MAG: BatD family protein [Pseudomonadales bacterium]|nr:BatD family protein [Pseudomonadales bacterium]